MAEPSIEQRTIREAIADRHEALRRERTAAQAAERRRKRDERAQQRREARVREERIKRARGLKAFQEAQEKAQGETETAVRALRQALRTLRAVPLDRHSDEGREKLRIIRSINAALTAVGRVGRGGNYDIDPDLGDAT